MELYGLLEACGKVIGPKETMRAEKGSALGLIGSVCYGEAHTLPVHAFLFCTSVGKENTQTNKVSYFLVQRCFWENFHATI